MNIQYQKTHVVKPATCGGSKALGVARSRFECRRPTAGPGTPSKMASEEPGRETNQSKYVWFHSI